MDLMTATTSYARLKHKYREFRAPSAHITVDGVEITDKLKAKVGCLSVDLSNGFGASSCVFDVLEEYQPANTAFDPKRSYARLQIGAKVEVALGYVVTETVFVGLVAEVDYHWDESGFYFHVTCLDAKFLMMKNRRLELHTGRKVSDAVRDMLNSQPFTAYTTGKTIDNTGKSEEELFLADGDDYTLAVRQAEQHGFEFFIFAGRVYYRRPPSSQSVIMELSPSSGLLEARFSLRGGALYKTTEVLGIDARDGRTFKGEAGIRGRFSKSSTAAKMLGNTRKVTLDRSLADASEASKKAGELMARAQGEFGRLWGRCIGIPELVPGRSVRISGLMPEANTAFYILEVSHNMDEGCFFTTFEAKVDSL